MILLPLFTIYNTQLNGQLNVNAATEMLTERSTERTRFDRYFRTNVHGTNFLSTQFSFNRAVFFH